MPVTQQVFKLQYLCFFWILLSPEIVIISNQIFKSYFKSDIKTFWGVKDKCENKQFKLILF